MDETLGFRLGRSNRAHVIVSASRRENPSATDYWDGNWLVCNVTIAAGGFRALGCPCLTKIRCAYIATPAVDGELPAVAKRLPLA